MERAKEFRIGSSEPTSYAISWSHSMPMALKAMTAGISSANKLCLRKKRPFLKITVVLDFFSYVDEVT
jgi:hypothetical protein